MADIVLEIAILDDPVLSAAAPVPIYKGLNVLYGLNGAGKTRMLQGIRNAVAGIRSSTRIGILVHATDSADPARPIGLGRKQSPTEALARALARSTDFDSEIRGVPLDLHDLTPGRSAKLIEEHLKGLLPGSGPAREWVLENKMFVFVPAGTSTAPAWHACAVATPNLDWVISEQATLDEAYERYVADSVDENGDDREEEEMQEVEDRYNDAIANATLFPTLERQASYSSGLPAGFRLGNLNPIGFGSNTADSAIFLSSAIDFGVDLVDYDGGVESATAECFKNVGKLSPAEDVSAGARDAENVANKLAESLSEKATSYLQTSLLDGPFAQLQLAAPHERFYRPSLEWRFSRDNNKWRYVGLDDLSRAEKIWAERAIMRATKPARRDSVEVHLFDEPESALHRAAESHMAKSLVSMTNETDSVVVAATHSPELLDTATANVIEIKRSGRSSVVQPLDAGSRDALSGLGLNPSDLLRLTRVFLLVEGLHDEVLLDHFLGDRLREARIEMIPTRGGKRLAGTTDSRVLFDFTDAHVVALLDNTNATKIANTWGRAVEAAATGNTDQAKAIVVAGIGYEDGESQYLTTWLTRALDRGLAARLTPQGLEAADIIEYLPVQRIVPKATSWIQLREQHATERASGKNAPKDFKEWLSKQFNAGFDEETLRVYAAGVPVPKEFERLMKYLEATSAAR